MSINKMIPNYKIQNGDLQVTPEEVYIDDLYDPLFNKQARDYLTAKYGSALGGLVGGYKENITNALFGSKGKYGMFGPAMGILSSFGRTMDKTADVALGSITEAINAPSKLIGNNVEVNNPLKRIMVEDEDYSGKHLLAAMSNTMSQMAGGNTVQAEDFKGMWNVPALGLELATDPGILGTALASKAKFADKSTSSILKNFGKNGNKKYQEIGQLMSNFDDTMNRIALNGVMPGSTVALRKLMTRINEIIGHASKSPYVDVPLNKVNNDVAPPPTNVSTDIVENMPPEAMEVATQVPEELKPLIIEITNSVEALELMRASARALNKVPERYKLAAVEEHNKLVRAYSDLYNLEIEARNAPIKGTIRTHEQALEEQHRRLGNTKYDDLKRASSTLVAKHKDDVLNAEAEMWRTYGNFSPDTRAKLSMGLERASGFRNQEFPEEVIAEFLEKVKDPTYRASLTEYVGADEFDFTPYNAPRVLETPEMINGQMVSSISPAAAFKRDLEGNMFNESNHMGINIALNKLYPMDRSLHNGVRISNSMYKNIAGNDRLPKAINDLLIMYSDVLGPEDANILDVTQAMFDGSVWKDPLKITDHARYWISPQLAPSFDGLRQRLNRLPSGPELIAETQLNAFRNDAGNVAKAKEMAEFMYTALQNPNIRHKDIPMGDLLEAANKRMSLKHMSEADYDRIKRNPIKSSNKTYNYNTSMDELVEDTTRYLTSKDMEMRHPSQLDLEKRMISSYDEHIKNNGDISVETLDEMVKFFEADKRNKKYAESAKDAMDTLRYLLNPKTKTDNLNITKYIEKAEHFISIVKKISAATVFTPADKYPTFFKDVDGLIELANNMEDIIHYNKRYTTSKFSHDIANTTRTSVKGNRVMPGSNTKMLLPFNNDAYTLGQSIGYADIVKNNEVDFDVLDEVAGTPYQITLQPEHKVTLANIAKSYGINRDYLQETVDKLNKYAREGKDIRGAKNGSYPPIYDNIKAILRNSHPPRSPEHFLKKLIFNMGFRNGVIKGDFAKHISDLGNMGIDNHVKSWLNFTRSEFIGRDKRMFKINRLEITEPKPISKYSKAEMREFNGYTEEHVDLGKEIVEKIAPKINNNTVTIKQLKPYVDYLRQHGGGLLDYITRSDNPNMLTRNLYKQLKVSKRNVVAIVNEVKRILDLNVARKQFNAKKALTQSPEIFELRETLLKMENAQGKTPYDIVILDYIIDNTGRIGAPDNGGFLKSLDQGAMDSGMVKVMEDPFNPFAKMRALIDPKSEMHIDNLHSLISGIRGVDAYNAERARRAAKTAAEVAAKEAAMEAAVDAKIHAENLALLRTIAERHGYKPKSKVVPEVVPEPVVKSQPDKPKPQPKLDISKPQSIDDLKEPTRVEIKQTVETEKYIKRLRNQVAMLPDKEMIKALSQPVSPTKVKAVQAVEEAFNKFDNGGGIEDIAKNVKAAGTKEERTLFSLIADSTQIKANNVKEFATVREEQATKLFKKLDDLENLDGYAEHAEEYIRLNSKLSTDIVKSTDLMQELVEANGRLIVRMNPHDKLYAQLMKDIDHNVAIINRNGPLVTKVVESGDKFNIIGIAINTTTTKVGKHSTSDIIKRFLKNKVDPKDLKDLTFQLPATLSAKELDFLEKSPLKNVFDDMRQLIQNYNKLFGITSKTDDNFIKHTRLRDEYGKIKYTDNLGSLDVQSLNYIAGELKTYGNNHGSFRVTNHARSVRGDINSYDDVFSFDPREILNSSLTEGVMDNMNLQTYTDMFLNDNFKVKEFAKTPEDLKKLFFDANGKNLGGNTNNLLLVSPRYDETGRVVGLTRYDKFTDAGLEAALKNPETIIIPTSVIAPLDRILRKDVKMQSKAFRFINKYLTLPFKFGILTNPGFILGNVGDASYKQIQAMANKYGTSVAEEVKHLANSVKETIVLSNTMSNVHEKFVHYLASNNIPMTAYHKLPDLMLRNPEALQDFKNYIKSAPLEVTKKEIRDVEIWLMISSVQDTHVFKANDGIEEFLSANATNSPSETQLHKVYKSPRSRFDKLLTGEHYERNNVSSWGIFANNPVSSAVMRASEITESIARKSAVLNDLKHTHDIDALNDILKTDPTDAASKTIQDNARVRMSEASNTANNINFDYNNVTDTMDAVSTAIPFPTFFLKNLGYWLEVLVEHPQVIDNITQIQDGLWDGEDEEQGDNTFKIEAKGRGAVALPELSNFFKGIYKPSPLNSMFSAFNLVNNPIDNLSYRLNPAFASVTGMLNPNDEDVAYRPHNTNLYQPNINKGDKEFSWLSYQAQRMNPYNKIVGNALRLPGKLENKSAQLSDFASSVFQPDF